MTTSPPVREINKFAFEGKLEELKDALTKIVASGGSIDKLVDREDSNRGPLHFAVLGKRVEIVRTLLEEYNCSPYTIDEVSQHLHTGYLLNLYLL